MSHINGLLRQIKQQKGPDCERSNPLREKPRTWTESGIPKKVLRRIIEETYQRSIGPNVESLRRYTAFSSQVYGELTPDFVSDIIAATGLRSNSLFLDLGSGVGNVALQASLESGCSSYGVELMPTPSALAVEQLKQFRLRCRMWAVNPGEVELQEGDMRANKRLDELIGKADVLLINNYAFAQERKCMFGKSRLPLFIGYLLLCSERGTEPEVSRPEGGCDRGVTEAICTACEPAPDGAQHWRDLCDFSRYHTTISYGLRLVEQWERTILSSSRRPRGIQRLQGEIRKESLGR